MPGPDSVGPNDTWRIVIEVKGQLNRQQTADFDRAIKDAVRSASQTARASAAITFNKTVPSQGGPAQPS